MPVPVSSIFDHLCIVLVATRNPLNIGAAARAMSNLGFPHLRLVAPYEASFREARSAVGAAPLLAKAEEFSTVPAAVADCALVVGTTAVRQRELHHPLKVLSEAAPLIRQRLELKDRVAILFGSEKRGLSNDDLSHCHWLMQIPTREEHVSMNLGQAVAVSLYELVRAQDKNAQSVRNSSPSKSTEVKPATVGELDRITSVLLEALAASGYLAANKSTVKEEKIRRMVRRMNLSGSDAELWLGMLRKMLWKINAGNKNQ